MSSKSFLIIEDTSLIAKAIRAMLQALGHTDIDCAENGLDALKYIEKRAYDILMLDLNMPEMDGIKFLEYMATYAPNSSLIVMSGSDKSILDAASAVAYGYNIDLIDTIEKPFTLQRIAEAVGNHKEANGQSETSSYTGQPILTEKELLELMTEEAVHLHYQPKINVRTGETTGAEALIRLYDAKANKYHFPNSFLMTMNKLSLNQDFTRLVVKRVMNDIAGWVSRGIYMNVAINVTSDDLEDPKFADFILAEAKAAKAPTKHITIEVTEHKILSNLNAALSTLARLRMNDVKISIDDFGTGASTLQQLKRLPCTELKVDRMFVQKAHEDSRAQKILKSCIALGEALDLDIVAEGAETIEDVENVCAMGVDMIQGWYFSKALPPEDFITYALSGVKWPKVAGE